MSEPRPDPEAVVRIFASKKQWHRGQARRPIREKFEVMLQLQQQDLELIRRRRPLRSWERPWPVDP